MGLAYIVIKGGLGNQLFQAAFGLALARRFGAEVRYLTHSYERDIFGRSYLLDRFANLAAPLVPRSEARACLSSLGMISTWPPSARSSANTRRSSLTAGGRAKGSFSASGGNPGRPCLAARPSPGAPRRSASQVRRHRPHVRRGEYGHFGLAKVDYIARPSRRSAASAAAAQRSASAMTDLLQLRVWRRAGDELVERQFGQPVGRLLLASRWRPFRDRQLEFFLVGSVARGERGVHRLCAGAVVVIPT